MSTAWQTRDAIEHGIAAIAGRRRGDHHGHGLLGLHPERDRVSKEFGILLAVAILVDALVMRMTLVPAFFTLLREKTWYIPGWMDRLLPNVTVEAPHEAEGRAASSRSRPRRRAARRNGARGARLRPGPAVSSSGQSSVRYASGEAPRHRLASTPRQGGRTPRRVGLEVGPPVVPPPLAAVELRAEVVSQRTDRVACSAA